MSLNITLTQLSYIVAVDTHRNFAKAADSVFITQPTLSMQIQKLERELGVMIFDRSKQPVEPTGIGRVILDQSRVILKESQKLPELIRVNQGAIEGEFRLGIIPTLAPSLLPLFLKNFTHKYPKVELVIEELQTHVIVERLRKDTLDAGLLATPLSEVGIGEIPLFYEPFVAYLPQTHRLAKKKKISIDDLDSHDLLLLNEGHCFRNQLIKLCRFSTPEKNHDKGNDKSNHASQSFRFESGNFDTLKKLVDQGFGMTLLPYLKALDLERKDHPSLRHFDLPTPIREISIVHSRSVLKKHIIDLLGAEIKKTVPKQLLSREGTNRIEPILNEALL
ncbi:MAG: LysR substrate-binding domain-containing protein [Chloroherpetonaceae bacterium]|nr:LysR substrate-binding domain-containing protein [Chloroherpetonaceae bacterium]